MSKCQECDFSFPVPRGAGGFGQNTIIARNERSFSGDDLEYLQSVMSK